VAALVFLAVLAGASIGILEQDPGVDAEEPRRAAVVEKPTFEVTGRAARPAPAAASDEAAPPGRPDAPAESEYRVSLRNRAEAQESFARARQALEKGDCGRAEELTTRAFIQNLVTAKATRDETGAVAESYEQAKEQVLPAAEKMWAFLIQIEQTRRENMCRTGNSGANAAGVDTPEERASAICESDPVTCRCLQMHGYSMQALLTETDPVKLEGILGNPALLACMSDGR
jgi:hypothetical protein